MNTVMIVTGESSGELYGSLLAKALKRKSSDLRIIGIGGERMKEAGVELISGIASAFGLVEAVSSYKTIKNTFKKAVDAIEKISPKVIVLIDYPDFNARVAKVAKKKGIKILYYVSPQVWAWRKSRAKTIASISDFIAVILPFEEEIYKKLGARCEFVGHPALEEIESLKRDKALLKRKLELNSEQPVIALLPGSRPHEMKKLLPVMSDVVKDFGAQFPDKNYQFIMPIAPNIDIKAYQPQLISLVEAGVVIKKENAIKALAVADMAVIASGTATLQAAFLETPMVVIYKVAGISYYIAKLIIDVKYISLVNIMSEKEVVKELIQTKADSENIIDELDKIMQDKNYRKQMIIYFEKFKEKFSGKSPSQRVSEIIFEMMS
jgi:lipid-A-disaccharide synthase